MKTYSVTFDNCNDCRTVISATDFKTALSIYSDTRNHNRFFQIGLSKEEKNTGVVSLICDNTDKTIYINNCKRVRK